jgi:acyl carrier protein
MAHNPLLEAPLLARGRGSGALGEDLRVPNELPASETDATLRAILRDVLGLGEDQVAAFDANSGLFGSLPELDSMAVAGLLTEIEDRLDIVIDDDEVDGEMLESYGNLLAFAEAKRAA